MTAPTLTRPPFRLTDEQYQLLVDAIADSRISKNPKGFSHVEAWDGRRWLIRIFGFGGFDIETKALDMVAQIEHAPGTVKYANGGSNNKTIWTVVYRAEIRLTVRDQFGGWSVIEDGAAGDAQNQPGLGDAHDNAMKTALSQGLKRCLVNWGDQFGLSLYNGGKTKPVVVRSLVAPEAGDTAAAPAAGLPVDEPVLPEPGSEQQHAAEPATTGPVDEPPADAAPAAPAPSPATPATSGPAPSGAAIRDWALKPGRTSGEIRDALTRLQTEHPAVAKRKLQNETGDQEELAAMLSRLADAAPADPPAAPAPDAAPMVTAEQLQRIHILFGQLGYTDRNQRLDIINNRILHLNPPVDSSKKLTAAEATQVVNALQERANQRQAAAA